MSAQAPRRIGIVANRDRSDAHGLARTAVAWLDERGHDVVLPLADAERCGLPEHGVDPGEFAGVDIAVSIGGDGTMLHTVDLVAGATVPVLGVNAGQLGYLAEVEPADLERSLERIVSGDYSVVERMTLSIAVESAGPSSGKWSALNEAVIEKTNPGKAVRLAVSVNNAPFTTYVADGLIVATPTGSTAYSFSAGGPIISPEHDCILVNPVAPHMLFDRALVLGPDETLRLVAEGRDAALSIDGRETGRLSAGDAVVCTGGPAARIVTLDGRDFHQILKTKFGLSDR